MRFTNWALKNTERILSESANDQRRCGDGDGSRDGDGNDRRDGDGAGRRNRDWETCEVVKCPNSNIGEIEHRLRGSFSATEFFIAGTLLFFR